MVHGHFHPSYLRSQLFVLHDLVSSGEPEHSAPPLRCVFSVLERLCEPPPHVLEHDVHELQAPQVQSTER